MRRIIALSAPFAMAAAASAQLTQVTPFTGDEQEGFEAVASYSCPPCFFSFLPGVFNGQADINCPSGGTCAHITGGWGFMCSIGPHGGVRLFGSPGGAVRFDFVQDCTMFGGYMGTNSGAPGGTIEFYDANNNLIGSDSLNVTADCSWRWNGWSSSTPFRSVVVRGGHSSEGFVMMDDMEVTFAGGCYPDCDGNGVLDLFDFLCFTNAFNAGQNYADCNGDQVLDLFDFLCFTNAFNAGCP